MPSRLFFFILVLLSSCTNLIAGKRYASSATEFRQILNNLSSGDTVILRDGVYDLAGGLEIRSGGMPESPVVIMSEHRGKVKFAEDSHFILRAADNVVIEGFEFASKDGPAVDLRGCSYVRITRNIFHLAETKRSNWIMITGDESDTNRLSHHNRIDHNVFEHKRELGNFITVEGTKKSVPQASMYDRIDHNYFSEIGPRAENFLEAIRVGSSEYSLSSGHTVIEENLFERCDGDPEYVSIKSSDDTVRHNTFRECLGTLSLRHGNRNVVEGNFILGNNRSGTFTDSTGKTWLLGTGGIRFCGDGMVIINNYLEHLTGNLWDASLAITNGDAVYGDGQPLTKHFIIRDAVIAFNTLVDNKSNFEIGYDGGGFQNNWWKMPPDGMTIADNIVVSSSDTIVKFIARPLNTRWAGNIFFARSPGTVSSEQVDGIRTIDPQLVSIEGVWRLPETSPARGSASGLFPGITTDIDGQARGYMKDAGADQFSPEPKRYRPLTPSDVGPWSD